jgi:serine/threonine protein kinase
MSDFVRDRVTVAVGELFDIQEELGRGGMSVVYRALDLRLSRYVALKVLPPELSYDPGVRERFRREARMAAQLSHPNVVPIHSVDERDGLAYFVMTLVEGESLGTRLARERRLPLGDACRIICEVADALAYAHSRGVVHRDVKPDNILLEKGSGRAMVTDFGIARAAESGSRLTVTGVAVGTPAYMSPEQALGESELDGRSDIYSLGVVAYHLLTGAPPFTANNTPSMLMKHVGETPMPLRQRRPEVPAALASAIERALEKQPGARWATAGEFREAIANADPASPSGERQARTGLEERIGARHALDRAEAISFALGENAGTSWGREAMSRAGAANLPESAETHEIRQRIRKFRHLLVTYVSVSGVLFVINASTGGDPWFLIPSSVLIADLLRRMGGFWADGIRLRDVFWRPAVPLDVHYPGGRLGAPARPVANEYQELRFAVAPAERVHSERASKSQRSAAKMNAGQASSLPPNSGRLNTEQLSKLPPAAREAMETIERAKQRLLRSLNSFRRVKKWSKRSWALTGVTLLVGITTQEEGAFAVFGMSATVSLLMTMVTTWKAFRLSGRGVSTWGLLMGRPIPGLDETPRPLPLPALALPPIASDVMAGPYGASVRRAAEDRVAILSALRSVGPADLELLPEIAPTVDALVERVSALAPTLHRLEADLPAGVVERIDERISEAEAKGSDNPEHARKIALLRRQRTSILDLMDRRDTLLGQLESAVLLLQNIKLDLAKVRSAGVQSMLEDVNFATQEARALSREISHVLGAASDLRAV